VGPFWSGGARGEPELLAAAYRRALELAAEHDCRSIALPALSTGAYRYPIDQASLVALETAIEFLGRPSPLELARFVLFDQSAYDAFASSLQQLIERR
jgi:O-acetyl-ADP-ribose deacetylase (regulator of RNase III)